MHPMMKWTSLGLIGANLAVVAIEKIEARDDETAAQPQVTAQELAEDAKDDAPEENFKARADEIRPSTERILVAPKKRVPLGWLGGNSLDVAAMVAVGSTRRRAAAQMPA